LRGGGDTGKGRTKNRPAEFGPEGVSVDHALLISKTIYMAPDKFDAVFAFILLFIAATRLALWARITNERRNVKTRRAVSSIAPATMRRTATCSFS
jgi:hypothetical protein